MQFAVLRSLAARTWLVGIPLLLAVAGCGPSGPEVVPVTGTVTRGGKPVADLFLNFLPDNGRPSWGTTDANGQFYLRYTRSMDGARVGFHKVWVRHNDQPKTPQEEMDWIRSGRKTGPPADIDAILKKYGDEKTTPLKIEVKSDGSPVDLVLD